MPAPQTRIAGRYRLLRQLGAGGMGRVWLAEDEMLDRRVAIKEVVIPTGLAPDAQTETRFRTLREARTAARLNHPHVIKIYDVIHTEQQPWIVMEYVPSRSLHEVISQDGALEPAEAARIGLAVLDALVAAHRAGVLHRDVKPANVLLAADGRVVLTDFGLATFDGVDTSVTSPGLVLGSVRYVAPERARDNAATPETDLWALGATLYAAVEGKPPYAGYSAMDTLTALATTLPEPPTHAGRLKPVLSGLLRHDPRDRFRAAEVRPLLERAADNGRPWRPRRPRSRRGVLDPAGSVSPGGSVSPVGSASPAGSVSPAGTSDPGKAPTAVIDSPVRRPEPAPDPAPPVRPPNERRHRLIASVLAAGIVLLAAGGALVVASAADRDSAPGDSGPSPGRSTSAAAIDPVLGPACPATGAVDVTAASRRPNWPALPANWTWYQERGGFRIAVPEGWPAYPGRTGLCFREPGDTRWLGVTTWTPGGLPLPHVTARETSLLAGAPPTGYHRIGFTSLPYYAGGADWEYTFIDASGTRMHTITRDFLISPDHGYTIVWCTRDFDWQPNLDNFRLVTASFAPPV